MGQAAGNTELGAEPITNAGAAGVSFDELDELEVHLAPDEEENEDDSDGDPTAKDNVKEPGDEEDDSDDDSDSDSEEEDEDDEENEEDPEDDSAEDEVDGDDDKKSVETTELAETVKGKSIKAEHNGEAFKLHTGATVPIKINGKVENIQVQELMNQYSGHQHYDQKFQLLDTDKTEFIERVENLNDFVQDIFDAGENVGKAENQEGKIKAAYEVIGMFGKLAGKDGRVLMSSLRNAFRDEAKEYADMDEQEQQIWDLQKDKDYTNIDHELNLKAQERQDSKATARQADKDRAAQYGLDSGVISEHVAFLKKNNMATDINTVVELSRISMADGAIKDFDPSMVSDTGLRDELTNIALKNPNVSKADLIDVLKEAFPKQDKAAKNLSRKLRKNGQPTKKKSKKKGSSDGSKRKPVSSSADLWDDVD